MARVGIALAALAVAVSLPAASAATPRARANGRDDTAWLQARLDASGGVVSLPKLPGGQCYATRGLWVSHDDTQIVSNGACITALGPGPVRLTSQDGDPVAADAVFFGNHSPGILVALATNLGRMVYGTDIAIVGNTIVRNGVKDTPPQHGGIVFDGGQDGGGGRVLVERNVIRGNRGAGLQGRGDVNLVVVARRNDLKGNSGGAVRGLKLRG